MVSRITRFLLALQLLAAIALYFLFRQIWPSAGITSAVVLSLLSVVLVRMAISINNFVMASRTRSKLPAQYRIGLWDTVRLFMSEFSASMITSSWTMPFRSFSTRVPDHPQGLPVLLVHGYGCNSGYWHSMSKALSDAQIVHHAIDMEPVIGSIDDYAVQIHEAVEALCRKTGQQQLVIVAHSMGGLATRAYLRDYGSAHIAKVITLGTPHHGTALAHFGVGINTQQMRWTATEEEGLASDWLRQLANEEDAQVYRLFISIYSHHDNIISPQTSSHLDGAKNIEFHAIGHVALGMHPVIHAAVIREIRDASRHLLGVPGCHASA
jgi:triacylglycerol esterase/lipase EstA (alpha/beta hydrolase family)